MADLYKALEQIHTIRGQLARGSEFRGYGPETVAATGVLAGAAALLQTLLLRNPGGSAAGYLAIWIATAAVALLVTGSHTVARTRRVHPGLARQMIFAAGESFLPAILAGGLVTLVLLRSAPHELWMLPGLWQIFYGLGIFASCRFMPRQMLAVAAWFLATGTLCLTTG
ncbi:MAG TPA: hypothetical protein VMF03_01055, partial [Steroidobacteraceae bacterium]|nr:hypothetical protein [Steroidobacteraceae bacterium]